MKVVVLSRTGITAYESFSYPKLTEGKKADERKYAIIGMTNFSMEHEVVEMYDTLEEAVSDYDKLAGYVITGITRANESNQNYIPYFITTPFYEEQNGRKILRGNDENDGYSQTRYQARNRGYYSR